MATRALRSLGIRRQATQSQRLFHTSRPSAEVYPNGDKVTLSKILANSPGRVVLVDYYADWCGPCRQLSPILERLAAEPNKSANGLPLDVVKIDTETKDGQELAAEHKISALPTVFAYKDGKYLNKFVGALPEPGVKDFLKHLLDKE